jgi:2-succinyl-5-enolpyruvyl-6-hydroxy-3-cyclohexene-1-carboxylate synthase
MLTSAKKNVQIIVEQLVHLGLRHVVVSPGSRDAPLIIAFNQHPEIETCVVPDERSAAFVALGMAQQLNNPVAVLCTSGSAVLNYYPAVSEAYYQGVPLIVLSADRPQEWVNQGDGQTIVQHDVFKNHIRFSVTLPEDEKQSWMLKREICTAYSHANAEFPGPVHINIPFSEPLYGQVEVNRNEIEVMDFHYVHAKNQFSTSDQSRLKEKWEQAERKMIICGQMKKDALLESYLLDIAKDPSVCILVENTSNLVHHSFNHCIDRTLNSISEEMKADFAPDLLITLGGAVVSKRIKAYLRTFKAKEHWKVGFDFPFMDTYQSLTESIHLSDLAFCKSVCQWNSSKTSRYGLKWKQLDFQIQEKAKLYFSNSSLYSDLTAFYTILDYLPEEAHLHMANSSVVRYCQLFDPIKSVHYWCNRGTSGIDGSSSTAVGAASIQKDAWHVLLTGDISFFYDSNAFWNHLKKSNLRIFLINNGGGAIFKIIPGPSSTQELNEFFVFNNQASAKGICEAFGLEYYSAHTLMEIEAQMVDFYMFEENGKPKLIEIFTQNIDNEKVLADYFEKIKIS